MTSYNEGTIWDYPELQEPPLMERRRCGEMQRSAAISQDKSLSDECGYVGDMPLRQTCGHCPATRTSPEEFAEYIATCPQCGLEHDEYGDSS